MCLLFLVPFFDPRRPSRLLHLDLLVLLGLGVSLFFYNRAEITTSVVLTYPVLLYVLGRMLWAGFFPRERDGPLIPWIPLQWIVIAAVVLACARIALNIVDSHVIDIGVAGVVGADHITHGQGLYAGNFAPGLAIRGDVYAPFNYLAYVPFELIFPWNGHWSDVPAARGKTLGGRQPIDAAFQCEDGIELLHGGKRDRRDHSRGLLAGLRSHVGKLE